jgi:membrane protein implicated in regulation of membrane protease activity
MRKVTWNYWLDVMMILLSLLLAISSFLLWVVFPRGYYAARALWVDLHTWGGLVLSIAVIVHLVLHWKWLARMTRRYLNRLRGRHTGTRRDLNARRHPRRATRPG